MLKKIIFVITAMLLAAGCSDNTSESVGGASAKVNVNISFNGNSADSGVMQTVQAVSGEPFILPENTYVRKGFVFAGWSTTSTGEVAYYDKSSINVNSDTILYAVWNAIDTTSTFKVTLHSNYDDNSTVNYFKGGSTFILPNTPYLNEKKGFLGWALSKDGGVVYTNQEAVQVYGNMDLYAVWTPNNTKEEFDVIFNNNNGNDCNITPEKRIYGGSIYLDYKQCTKNGYVFLGWGEAGTNQVIYKDGDVITVTRDLNLEAVWAKESDVYSITFNFGAGEGLYGSPQILYVKKDDGIVLPDNSYWKRSNYVPAGYSTISDSDDNYIEPLETFIPNGNTTLYIVWKDGSNKQYANQTRWVYGLNMDNAYWVGNNSSKTAYRNGDENWYDIYQGYNELCWSASSSNMILWWYHNNKAYVDKYNAEIGNTLPEFSYSVVNNEGYSPIFEIYRRNMDADKGSQPTIALNYFILGNSAFKEGAYFKEVFNNTILAKTEIAGDKARFNHIMNTVFNDKKIISIETNAPGPHIITVWGADYGNDGFINRIYITDSATYNSENNGKWGNMVSADIVYYDNAPYIRYLNNPDHKLNRMHTFSLGQDIWEAYFNQNK